MASMEHLDLLLGEALDFIDEAAGEFRELGVPELKGASLRLGNAIGELWAVRERLYELKPDLKPDFVKERESDEARYDRLYGITLQACMAEEKGDIENTRFLFEDLLKISRFGYFRLVAEAGLYRILKNGKNL